MLKNRRPLRAVAAAAVAVVPLLAAVPVSAGSPEVVEASASATALDVSVLGVDVTLGAVSAELSGIPDPSTSARAVGGVKPLLENSVSVSSVSGSGSDSQDACVVVLDDVPLLSGGELCSAATSEVVGGLPRSAASASPVEVGVDASGLLDDVGLTDVVSDGVTTVIGSLVPILGPVLNPIVGDGSVEDLTGTLGELLDGVLDSRAASIAAGGADVSVEVTGSSVVTSSSTGVATVSLLPDLLTGSVAVVEVAPSEASVVRDRATGETTFEATSPVARVSLAPEVLGLLGLGDGTILEVAAGEVLCPDLPEPLSLCVNVGAPVFDEAAGTVSSGAVTIDLLGGADGGVRVAVGEAVASSSGALAVEAPEEPEAPTTTVVRVPDGTPTPDVPKDAPVPELPKTGASIPMAAAVVAGLVGVPGLVLSRRLGR